MNITLKDACIIGVGIALGQAAVSIGAQLLFKFLGA